MMDCRRSSCFGRDNLARLSIGLSGTKVTGPWSGQSDGYALSHSVHPAETGWQDGTADITNIQQLPTNVLQLSSCQRLFLSRSTCPLTSSYWEEYGPCYYSSGHWHTCQFLSNSDQMWGYPPTFLMELMTWWPNDIDDLDSRLFLQGNLAMGQSPFFIKAIAK